MQILSFVLASLTILAAESAKSRPAALDVAAIVEQAKQLDPQQQQAWIDNLHRRLKRATTLVLKPADAEKKLAEYEMLFGHNPPDWQQLAKLVQQTDVAEKAAIGQLTRQYRIALYESLFGQRKEYELRHDALRRVLKAWEASGQPFSRQELMILWLEEAVRCNTRGTLAPLPPDPDFSKDPPWTLPADSETIKQPADKDRAQPPKSPTAEKQTPQPAPAEKQTPKSAPAHKEATQPPPAEAKPEQPPSGEDKAQPSAVDQPPAVDQPSAAQQSSGTEQQLPRPSPTQLPPKLANEPSAPGHPPAAPQSSAGVSPADHAADQSSVIRPFLERLGSAPLAERTADHTRLPEAPDTPSDAATTPQDDAQSHATSELALKPPADAAGMSEPPEPPIWQMPRPPAAEQQERPSTAVPAVTDKPRALRDAPAIDTVIGLPEGQAAAKPVEPPGWSEQLERSPAKPSLPAPLQETDAGAALLSEPRIQTDYYGGGLDTLLEVEAVCVDDSSDHRLATPPQLSLPVRRSSSTDGAAVPPDDAHKPLGTRRPLHAPPLETLALHPVPLEQLPRAQVNLVDLNARINGYNYSLRALEAQLHDDGAWDSARIRLAIERLKKLLAQRRDLEVFRELLPAEQRRLVTDFEPVRPIIAQLGQRIWSARQAAEQVGATASQDATSAQAAAAELERLDALSRELAEFGQQ